MQEVEALRNAIKHNTPDGLLFDKPPTPQHALSSAIWRFLKAWSDNPELGSDHAVLLRQIARWSEGDWHLGFVPEILRRFFLKSQIDVSVTGSLRASPFRPSWLTDDALPATGIDSAPVFDWQLIPYRLNRM